MLLQNNLKFLFIIERKLATFPPLSFINKQQNNFWKVIIIHVRQKVKKVTTFFIKWKDINDSSEWCYNSYKWYEWNDINDSGEWYKW